MPDPITGLVVGGASLAGSAISAGAASSAGAAQAAASAEGIAEQRRQFDAMRELLDPYTEIGVPALQGLKDIVGLSGAEKQTQAIATQEASPFFQAMVRQGENALLQNTSATGGLRGGNLQGALAQLRPAMLNQFVEQQYGRLGGLASLGQQSAAGVGNAGLQTGTNISSLLQQAGAAQAGARLASAQAWGNALNIPSQFAGLAMATGWKGF